MFSLFIALDTGRFQAFDIGALNDLRLQLLVFHAVSLSVFRLQFLVFHHAFFNVAEQLQPAEAQSYRLEYEQLKSQMVQGTDVKGLEAACIESNKQAEQMPETKC